MAEDAQPETTEPAGISYDFRPVMHGDMILLARWLREPVVAAWWRDPVRQLAEIQQDLANPQMEQVIVTADGDPIAYAQIYEVHSWDAPHLADQPHGALAIDCFAGPDGMGYGKAWLRELGDRLLHSAFVIVADPEPGNIRAISAYQGAGFTDRGTGNDAAGKPARIMTRYR